MQFNTANEECFRHFKRTCFWQLWLNYHSFVTLHCLLSLTYMNHPLFVHIITLHVWCWQSSPLYAQIVFEIFPLKTRWLINFVSFYAIPVVFSNIKIVFHDFMYRVLDCTGLHSDIVIFIGTTPYDTSSSDS